MSQDNLSKKRGNLQNILSVLFVLIALSVVAYFGFIFANPDSELNVLAVPTPLPIVVTATPLPLDIRFEVVEDGIRYLPADDLENCEGNIIAGQINGTDEELRVQIVTDTQSFEVLSGTQPRYGDQGFEVQLSTSLIRANYALQLFSMDNIAVTEAMLISTQANCETSIAFVEFIQVDEE